MAPKPPIHSAANSKLGAGTLSRRGFLQATGALAGGVLMPELILPPAVNSSNTSAHQVALAQADSYEPALIRQQVNTLLDQLGGLADVVRPGDRVALKTNLTGGLRWADQIKVPAIESYITHPEVVRALGAAVLDAGAQELYIIEAINGQRIFWEWGYAAIAQDLGATLIDLNHTRPYSDYISHPVGEGWLIYEEFTFNPIVTEIDVLMSVAKLKCHAEAGVTLAMKNLVGLVPAQFYRLAPDHVYRSALHGSGQAAHYRLPGVIVDLNRARPIDFALIDGVKTSEIGEGPWVTGWTPFAGAEVLIAGKNPVATDAVAMAVMGFDPTAQSFDAVPFQHSLNYLHLAQVYGLGSNDLDTIEIVGAALDDVQAKFQPYTPA